MKQIMIEVIRQHQYYKAGALEAMSEDEIRDIYEGLLDWIG